MADAAVLGTAYHRRDEIPSGGSLRGELCADFGEVFTLEGDGVILDGADETDQHHTSLCRRSGASWMP